MTTVEMTPAELGSEPVDAPVSNQDSEVDFAITPPPATAPGRFATIGF